MNLNAGLVVNAEAIGGSSFSFLRNIFSWNKHRAIFFHVLAQVSLLWPGR